MTVDSPGASDEFPTVTLVMMGPTGTVVGGSVGIVAAATIFASFGDTSTTPELIHPRRPFDRVTRYQPFACATTGRLSPLLALPTKLKFLSGPLRRLAEVTFIITEAADGVTVSVGIGIAVGDAVFVV